MAFLRGKAVGGQNETGFVPDIADTVCRIAIPCIVVFSIFWSAAALIGLHSASPATIALSVRPVAMASASAQGPQVPSVKTVVKTAGKSARPAVDPFDKVIAQAGSAREKLHAAFGITAPKTVEERFPDAPEIAFAAPLAERFDRSGAQSPAAAATPVPDMDADPLSSYALSRSGLQAGLAYAAYESGTEDHISLAMASIGGFSPRTDSLDVNGLAGGGTDIAMLPDFVEHLPSARPSTGQGARIASRAPERADGEIAQQALAYVRPDKPASGAFRKLFNTPKAGDRVAVYDISAAVVHMPDGTKLEAHSGIGKMVDNPRYAHVKMKGPTPPNTYKLTMREKRFHGVEAIRMTPIGDQTMHGRDGILAHSYLLRGGRAESHGCVAFKDYPRFLKAFKQGKVTHMIVVPSVADMPTVRLASSKSRR